MTPLTEWPDPPEGFFIDERPEGPTLMVRGGWKPAAAEVLESGRVDGLVLGAPAGYLEPSLEFLRPWPLRRFMVIDREIRDVQPIHRLGATLEELHVQTDPRTFTHPRTHFDLGQFPHLTKLSVDWPQIRDSIARAPELEELEVRRYREEDLRPLKSCPTLKALRMLQYPQVCTLGGVSDLPRLADLRLGLAAKLADISELAACAQMGLRRLEFESCGRIDRIDQIGELRGLEHLNISECNVIESLSPLRALKRLRVLWMWGTTRVQDNDLSPLLSLSGLRELRIQSRRSYRPSVDDVREHLSLEL